MPFNKNAIQKKRFVTVLEFNIENNVV